MEKASISVTVFEADDPELYAWIQSLPVGKQRRRSLLIERLRGGGAFLPSQEPQRESPKPRTVEPPKPQPESEAISKKLATTKEPLETVDLHSDDLDEVFGTD